MKKNEVTVRSSAAEYLTFIASTGDNPQSIEVRYEDENIWLTQKALAALYEVEVPTINYHIKKIFEDMELKEGATIRNFLIVQNEGARSVEREVAHYDLSMIIAVGFKVNSQKAVQFRKWAGELAKNYTIRGYVLDKERFMESDLPLTNEKSDVSVAKNYLQKEELEQLEQIVTMYLDYAEYQAQHKNPMTMETWVKKLDAFLQFNEEEILHDAGRVNHEIAKVFAEKEYDLFRGIQDKTFHSDFDLFLAEASELAEG